MATFKACVRKKRADGYYTVFIRCTHKRKADYISTDKMVDGKGLTKTNDIKDAFVLAFCASKIVSFIEKLNKLDIEQWDVKEVTEYLKKEDEDVCFSEYARKYKREMETVRNMARNARNYELAYQHLERFAGTNKIMFSRFTTKFINDWIKSLNTTARAKEMYPICVRQIFKAGIDEHNDYDREIIRIKTNPWARIKIPSADVPEKKAIDVESVRNFFTVPLPPTKLILPLPELARDVAMITMCMAGINTVDIYYLKKSNLKDGVICYNRRKTMKFRRDKAYLEIRVPDILKPIFEKYKTPDDDERLFNFHERYTSEDAFNANVNGGIRRICEFAGIEKYCVYTFRHTWGTVAQNKCKASTEEVGFAMNHSSAHQITEGYIKKDYEPVSKLNQKVIDYIFNGSDSEGEGDVKEINSPELRISPKYLVKGTVYFKGKALYSFTDTGYNNIREVIAELASNLPDDIPMWSILQFKIDNLDKEESKVYDRQKGKGF